MKKPAGFTLIELLVAMAVMALLVVLLLSIVDSASKLWRSNESRVDAYREARVAVNLISKDLQNSVAGANSGHIRLNADAYSRLPGEAIKNITNGGAVLFLSRLPSTAQESGSKSDVCEVGYFLAYGKSSAVVGTGAGVNNAGLRDTLNLYRYFRSSDPTFQGLTNNNLFSTTITLSGAETELLARNIKSFTITPYNIDSSGLPVAYTNNASSPLPDLVEIKVTALNQETAKKLSTTNDWISPPSGLSDVILQNQQVFVSRVKLNKP